MLATLGGAVAALLIWDLWVNSQMDYQQSRNQRLVKQIALLDQEVAEIRDLQRKRNELIERMRVIQSLQGNRPVIVRLLDQLVKTIPDGVFYTSLETKANVVSIEGVAESNNRVSSLMRQLDASDWLENPNLDAVQAAPEFGEQATTFALTVNLELTEDELEVSL